MILDKFSVKKKKKISLSRTRMRMEYLSEDNLVITYLKSILIQTIQTTSTHKNHFWKSLSKHKSIYIQLTFN
jgi:hypothetical protein